MAYSLLPAKQSCVLPCSFNFFLSISSFGFYSFQLGVKLIVPKTMIQFPIGAFQLAIYFANANLQCLVVLTNIDPNLHDDFLPESLPRNIKVSATGTGKRKHTLLAERLAANWE
jgi:hypothetical protein